MKQSVWKSLAESICFLILLELLQVFPFVTGTFDLLDICAEIMAAEIAALISICFYKYKDKHYKEEKRENEEKY